MHLPQGDIDGFFYWVLWGFLLGVSKVMGFFGFIASALPSEVTLPVHNVWYLPQLEDAVPALVMAVGCAFISSIIHKIIGLLWNKFIVKK